MNEPNIQKVIDKYFQDNPNALVRHHIDSYNDFFKNGIMRIFKEKNPIRIIKEYNDTTKDFDLKCNLYLGGKNGDKLYFGKPMIYDDDRAHFMYPNEARLRNMTYGITLHYDVEVEFFINNDQDEKTDEDMKVQDTELPTHTEIISKIFLGRFPIMMMSDLCILSNLTPSVRFELGECRNDKGGYFIIDGKEKCIVSQEKFADNMLYVRDKVNEIYSHSAEIRSVSEDASKPIRTLAVRMMAPSASYTNNQIVVEVPNVRKPVPLFILMRALGVESDKSIIEHCLLDINKNRSYVDLFIPSVHDAGKVFNQVVALKYIATLTKGKTVPHVMEILSNYFLPHIGEMNFIDKAYFLGHMVKEMLKVYKKETRPTDRDSFKYKRVELSGSLMYDLFKEYYNLQQKNITQKIDKEYYYHQGSYNSSNNFIGLIMLNYKEIFSERVLETGFKKAFKGNWGSQERTKKAGVVQDLNRLSFNSALSHLRKINLPLDASAKVIGPRLLHSSQWGIIDPVDTPDGGNVGLHKHLAIMSFITNGISGVPLFKWLQTNSNINVLSDSTPLQISFLCKVFINGNWVGVISKPKETVDLFKTHRRMAIIPIYTSIAWDIKNNTININSDAGRLCRPIFHITDKKASYDKDFIIEKLKKNDFTWNDLISGFSPKKENFTLESQKVYMKVSDLYNTTNLEDLVNNNAIIEYIDTSETEGLLISSRHEYDINKNYTHIEIHPSCILGVMGNQVIFPENNPLPRDLFACGQMKQAVSLYHSNYQSRIDKMGVVLNNGQIPLVKSMYLDKISNEQHPYGENVIVAIMCYNGYNVEDSILFNEGSVKRGLFRTTYFNMYESYEESSNVGNSQIDSKFANIENENVTGQKPGFDYSYLDDYGIIKENTYLDENVVLIGKTMSNLEDPEKSLDVSVFPKKGQKGYVDKAFMTEGEEGFRLAKVRVRNERIPGIGDKFCSRCGQKGTIGLLIPEESMPFTEEGIRPDIIINPHAIPSRMTIGQLVESLLGKACSIMGGFGDCTAFKNKGPKHNEYGEILKTYGYNSSGCEILYNGETGEQLQTEIYVGPTYYMRLKHMVKDKINYRARGPRTMLTRQTVQGRANDGGLRIGEMERDGVLGHGATKFLQESMLVRGDDYYMAVCNHSGMIAVYNESKNIFLSPYVDGPLKFTKTVDKINDGPKSRTEENLKIDNVSKYGRSFSIVRVPYALKLLIQELQCMNIQMRIITEDNIGQLESMTKSNNIVKLLGENTTIASIVSQTRSELNKSTRQANKRELPPSEIISDYTTNEPTQSADASLDVPLIQNTTATTTTTTTKPEQIGWRYVQDTENWVSLILDNKGVPSDFWNNENHNDKNPFELPKGWKIGEATYDDGTPIPTYILSQQLFLLQEPNNWNRSIDAAKSLRGRIIRETDENVDLTDKIEELSKTPYTEPGSPMYVPVSNINVSEQYTGDTISNNDDSPPYVVGESPPYVVGDSPPFVMGESPPFVMGESPKAGDNDLIENLLPEYNKTMITNSISDINKSSLNSVVTNKSILDVEETVDNEDGEKKPEEVTKKITSDLV